MTQPSNRHKLCLEKARRPWGRGWDLLTQDVREALIAREVLHLLMQQDESLEKFAAAKALVADALGPLMTAEVRS